MMKWSDVLGLKAWSPLSTIAVLDTPVVDGLYSVGPNAYVFTRTVNRNLEPDPQAPFVTFAYWGCSLEAVMRGLGGGMASLGTESPAEQPPAELLNGAEGTYGEILDMAISSKDGFSEGGSYSNKGEFLHKVVRCGRFEYRFLSADINRDERPYCIEIRLLQG